MQAPVKKIGEKEEEEKLSLMKEKSFLEKRFPQESKENAVSQSKISDNSALMQESFDLDMSLAYVPPNEVDEFEQLFKDNLHDMKAS